MKAINTQFTLIMFIAAVCFTSVDAAPVSVPGIADPWLAGMPDGSTASSGDVAPAQSPVLVPGLTFMSGSLFTFTVSGGVGFAPDRPLAPSDGGDAIAPHADGTQNGISALTAPHESLIGVFLSPTQPSFLAAPAGLDFSSAASRDYLTLAPLIQQVFFIGDGLTSNSVRQQIAIPTGATRLFLGSMDGLEWSNNTGSFSVTVANVPEPSSLLLLLSIAALSLQRCLLRPNERNA